MIVLFKAVYLQCMKLIQNISRVVFRKSLIIAFLHGFFVAFLIGKYQEYRYEEALYRSIVEVNKVQGNDRQTFINLVNTTFDIQFYRSNNLNLSRLPSYKGSWLRSGDVQLLDGVGACGNYAHILAELCQVAGFESRIVQLSRGNIQGSHIVVEANIQGRWAAVDALYKIIYYNKDSSFASLDEVRNNRFSYSDQVPADYPYRADYQKYTYTNWNKIPVLMPLIRRVLVVVMGEERVAQLSLRTYFLNAHKSIFYFSLFAYFIFSIFTFWALSYLFHTSSS